MRGQGEAAVAADHRGDAVDVGRRGRRVPEELGVVVGVRVDDAGRDHQPGGVELGAAGSATSPDLDDAAVLDADVGLPGGTPGAVDDRAGSDHVVEHWTSDVVRVLPGLRQRADAASLYDDGPDGAGPTPVTHRHAVDNVCVPGQYACHTFSSPGHPQVVSRPFQTSAFPRHRVTCFAPIVTRACLL